VPSTPDGPRGEDPRPQRPIDDDRRRPSRREWTGLSSPAGFERCVRATVRELYGYVALLVGNDRREAERHVIEVYRSLFRAARSGQVDSVNLGALRSATRRLWLEEHRGDLVAVEEVSTRPASTIGELSPLERAALVLLHVNGMTHERAAAEIGRGERDVRAVGAHAVRRLRGTDDTSGAWLRAYLGPGVSPAAGLVDRIVSRLGDPTPAGPRVPATIVEADTADSDTAGADTGAGSSVDGDAPAEEGRTDPVTGTGHDTDDLDDADADADGDARSEAATVVPVVPDAPSVPADGGAPSDRDVELDSFEDDSFDGEPFDDEVPDEAPGRPMWALLIAAVLLLGVIGALVALALRGDTETTLESTPSAATTTTSTTMVPGVDETDVTLAPVAGDVTFGFDPACADTGPGGEVPAISWGDTLGRLGEVPALTITFPESLDRGAADERLPTVGEVLLRPDGPIVVVRPPDAHTADQAVVARVGFDGTVVWTRCFDRAVELRSVPDGGVELAVRGGSTGGTWVGLSVSDGSTVELDALQAAVLDEPVEPTFDEADGPTIGSTYDAGLGRSVLAVIDDGQILWELPEVVLAGAFRAEVVGDEVLLQGCVPTDEGADCAAGSLQARNLLDGDLVWERPGDHLVPAFGDGLALIGNGSTWELVDVGTGDPVQRWDDPEVFPCCDGVYEFSGGALVVLRPGTAEVWLGAETGVGPASASIL
jgi:DNA-directed RNA polymerase specialized sigma24 family protein